MKSYPAYPNLVYDYCEHMEYTPEKGFSLWNYDETFPVGFDKDGREHVLFLCPACGERMEAKMFLNFLSKMKLNLKIKNGNLVELSSKNLWTRFLEILKVQ